MKTLNLIVTAALIILSAHCFAGNGSKMSGTYTIGASASANFKTITAAVAALDSNGANGQVTFMVEKNNYNQTEIIAALQNVSVMGNIAFVNADENNDNNNTADDATDAALAAK